MAKITGLRCVELFAGGGGLALGARRAGLTSAISVEWDKDSCDTLRANSRLLYESARPLVAEMDVRDFGPDYISGDFDVLLGGPPCQPFSIGGQKKGFNDERDGFPHFLRLLRETRPKAFLIENVKGLTSPRFSAYVDFLLSQLRFVEIQPRSGVDWLGQKRRLDSVASKGGRPSYAVHSRLLNAVDFGVPQRRERFFIIGVRTDIQSDWVWPEPTHSDLALIYDKYVTGNYFERHGLRRPVTPKELRGLVDRLTDGPKPALKAHRTVRDAFMGLPEPRIGQAPPGFPNHIGVAGGKTYKGHTGSPYDLPAKTLKAGVHGCPGGENMLAKDDGSVRYFTVREMARLQTFPDNYEFRGSRSECMRQIGNAVAVELAKVIVRGIADTIQAAKTKVRQLVEKSTRPTAQLR